MKDVMTLLRGDNFEKALSHREELSMTSFRRSHTRMPETIHVY
jgi:hypothetical protein